MDNNDLIRRGDALNALSRGEGCGNICSRMIRNVPAVDAVEVPETGIGDMSDGYHTFNELYHQRAVLFAALVKAYKSRAWKSWRHSDGELPFGKEDYFIVGIDTPEGSYTYHYHGEYWDIFDCQELPFGKEWDGHTDKDVTRLLSLPVDAVDASGATKEAVELILEERRRQVEQWGEQVSNHPYEWMSILGEEFGELCRAVNETCFQNPKEPELGGNDNIISEAVQVATVAIAIIEACLGQQKDGDA